MEYNSPFFKPREFACKCSYEDCVNSHEKMDSKFLEMLFRLRSELDFPFNISSGYRCDKHNKDQKGSRFSYHKRGRAVDLIITDSVQRFELVEAATRAGFSIIVYSNFVHLDNRDGIPKLLRGNY